MNLSELNTLRSDISNEARVIYCLALRPSADSVTGNTEELNYKDIRNLLNSASETYRLGRQLNKLILELAEAGLVEFLHEADTSKSFNGQKLRLPLMIIPQEDFISLHQNWSVMRFEWQPNLTLFEELAALVGIIEKEYYKEELGDFVSYWMGRQEISLTEFQWNQKFVTFIKNKRLAKSGANKTKIGTQSVTKKAEVVADNNAKKLVEKYRGKYQR